jgi:hypothetical protein
LSYAKRDTCGAAHADVETLADGPSDLVEDRLREGVEVGEVVGDDPDMEVPPSVVGIVEQGPAQGAVEGVDQGPGIVGEVVVRLQVLVAEGRVAGLGAGVDGVEYLRPGLEVEAPAVEVVAPVRVLDDHLHPRVDLPGGSPEAWRRLIM